MNAMNSRSIIITTFTVLCGAAFCGLVAQGRQLAALRDEQKRLATSNQAPESSATEKTAVFPATSEVPRELLQLRAEVARLTQQQRDLAGARQENEKLRLQVEQRRTNRAAARFTGAYIKKSEAKWLGYNTPEDTLQSFFWAMQNHDADKLFESFTTEIAARGKEEIAKSGRSLDELFKDKELPPGFSIANRQQNDDGSVQLEVRIFPDLPGERFLFRQIGGQWKLESPH